MSRRFSTFHRSWRESSRTCATRSRSWSRRGSTAERVRFVGSVGPAERSEVLGGACALLHRIGFDEPFGFSVVEAMVRDRRDRVSPGVDAELIQHGVSGFLVDDVEAAVAAARSADALHRAGIRTRPWARFGRERMVDAYLDAYAQLLS